MDKSLLLYRGGIRSAEVKLADGEMHTLYYKARTPNELAAYFGGETGIEESEKGHVARQKYRAKFIAESLCNEDGTPLLSQAEAELIPGTLKGEICALIIKGSNESAAGNGSQPGAKSGTGTP